LLQQFARYPRVGAVKTRLAAAIGTTAACTVHEELLLRTGRTLLDAALGDVELWLDRPGEHPVLAELLGLGARGPFLQQGDDLGQRMRQALGAGLAKAGAVVLVGSDCPDLDGDYLSAAFDALASHDLVYGPAEDGGYVLVGCRRLVPAVFADIPWGTDAVLAASLAAARRERVAVALLAPRYDVDRVEDLERWRGPRERFASPR
jgi:rSAM/selenodomain-associated transferase 1